MLLRGDEATKKGIFGLVAELKEAIAKKGENFVDRESSIVDDSAKPDEKKHKIKEQVKSKKTLKIKEEVKIEEILNILIKVKGLKLPQKLKILNRLHLHCERISTRSLESH